MLVVDDLESLPCLDAGSAVALGNFDGVHLGHRDIFRTLVRRAQERQIPSVVYTFETHPLKILAPERAPLLLNTPTEKVHLIAASRVDILARVPFSPEVATCPAEDFVRLTLVEKLRVKAIVVGYDFAFGCERQGTGSFLREQGEKYGFSVDVLQPVGNDGSPYSSSRVRELLLQGEVEKIPSLLGRHYTLAGTVVHGEKRGREIGFPTANLLTDKEQLPRSGVYAVRLQILEREYSGVVNLGTNPTFGEQKLSIEAHIFDFSGDLYGQEIRLYFVARLRDEQKFAGPSELIAAIRNDVIVARKELQNVNIVQYHEYLAVGQS